MSATTSSSSVLIAADEALRTPGAVFLDCRAGAAGRAAFLTGHVPGAHYADLDKDLAKVGDPSSGGRHPLPAASEFAVTVGEWGISERSPVFVYDASAGAMAATRAWWMLRALGHRPTRIVDGGWTALIAALEQLRMSMESGAQDGRSKEPPYPSRGWQWPTATLEDVDQARQDPSWLVIDVRSAERFAGHVEPFDPVAGHIPGARNLPYEDHLGDGERFLDARSLRSYFEARLDGIPPERTIVHCGSGVTACHTLAALAEAGMEGARLYVGSYSEWCRSGRPIATSGDGSRQERDGEDEVEA